MFSIIRCDELLGRAVFSSQEARRVETGSKFKLNTFLPKKGERKISVTRLPSLDENELNQAGQKISELRQKTCYGWAVIVAEKVRKEGRNVEASPQPGNCHHADIILPEVCARCRKEQKRHAAALAADSTWKKCSELADGPSN